MICLLTHLISSRIVYLFPESKITAVDLPQEKAAKTGALQMKIAGTWNFSNMNSVSFSLVSLLCSGGSVKSKGVSLGLIIN